MMKTPIVIRRFQVSFISIVAGALLLNSCSVEKEFDHAGDLEEEGIEMILKAGAPGTRTDNSGNSTLWSEGDALSVFHSAAGQSTFWSSWFGFYGYGNMFQGTVRKLSATNDWYAVYPYKEENTSPDQIRLTFPASQTQVGNSNKAHFAGESFPMVGKTKELSRSEDLSMSMANLLSAAEFKVMNEQGADEPIFIKEITLTASVPIAGNFTVDMTEDTPVITPGSGATKTVKLTVAPQSQSTEDLNALTISPGEFAYFYLAVAPFEIPAGDQVKIKVTAAPSYAPGVELVYYHTISVSESTAFSTNTIKPVNVHFNTAESEAPDTSGAAGEVDLEPGEQPEDGVYLLVHEDGENSMAFAPMSDQKVNNYAIPVSVVDGVVIPKDGEDLSGYAVSIEVATDADGNPKEHPNDKGHYAYNVRNSEGYYIFYSTGGGTLEASDALQIKETNTMEIDGTTYEYFHTFVQEEDGVQILSSISGASGGNKYLLAYSLKNGFYYEENNSGQKLHLYLLGGSAKEKQHLSFSETSVEYDFDAGGDFVEPTLDGAHTHVTYTSSNTSVATVDASGAVTIHGAGTATITAKAEASDTYYAGTASYSIISTSSSVQTWYKADAMVAGESYLIVSNGYALQNNGGSVAAVTVSVADDMIMLNASADILWTSTSGNQLVNNSQYLGTSSSSSGGYFPGFGSLSLAIGSQSNAAAWTYDADRSYMTFSSNSGYGGATTYYLYYSSSSNAFTVNSSSGSSHIAALYTTTKPLTPQKLSFEKSNVRWVVGEGQDYTIGGSYDFPQEVSGAQTPVTYTSSNTEVATISGSQITVCGLGSTTITASAPASEEYKAGTASYTLRIAEPLPGGFTDLGTFNLENDKVSAFLNEAEIKYTDDNYTSTSIVGTYSSSASDDNRLDVPKPVTLTWDTASSGTTTVTIFSDEALENVVWTQTTTSGKTSDDVYNLIPGRTYYCTVEADNGLLLKGAFNTEGRRRMIKASNTANLSRANNFRDLGGMNTVDGKTIKYGWIFRGTNLDSTTDAEQELMAGYLNIGWDIDLRQSSEGKEAFASKYNVTYEMSDYYPSLSELTTASKVRQTMQAFIAAAKAGKASYFHCRIGSDRTGYWGLLIEGLLGVSAKDCSIDFELTSFAKNVTSGNRERNSSGYLFYQGMEDFKKKSYYSTYKAEDEATALMKTINRYLVEEVGISQSDIDAFKSIVLE